MDLFLQVNILFHSFASYNMKKKSTYCYHEIALVLLLHKTVRGTADAEASEKVTAESKRQINVTKFRSDPTDLLFVFGFDASVFLR